MSYSPADDGSDMDATTWIAMRDALVESNEALGIGFAYIVRGGDLLSVATTMTEAMENAEAILKRMGVK